VFDEACFETLLVPIQLGTQQQRSVKEACAIAAYRAQTAIPVIGALLCDDAPQFKLLTETLGLCWVHDGRHYKKLAPVLADNKLILDGFLSQCWAFYRKLKAYKASPTSAVQKVLYEEFNALFTTRTDDALLNERIAKTLAKRSRLWRPASPYLLHPCSRELLVCLKRPELPLHNNASELAARVQARARDVSLHTRSEAGTTIKDSLMTISQTAKKLGVSTYEYIRDRVSGNFKLTSLAELISQRSRADNEMHLSPS
jgi:hypothetical protein